MRRVILPNCCAPAPLNMKSTDGLNDRSVPALAVNVMSPPTRSESSGETRVRTKYSILLPVDELLGFFCGLAFANQPRLVHLLFLRVVPCSRTCGCKAASRRPDYPSRCSRRSSRAGWARSCRAAPRACSTGCLCPRPRSRAPGLGAIILARVRPRRSGPSPDVSPMLTANSSSGPSGGSPFIGDAHCVLRASCCPPPRGHRECHRRRRFRSPGCGTPECPSAR